MNKTWSSGGWLDVDDQHPRLFGEAILLRDDDGMGFSLNLEAFKGKYVRISIQEVPHIPLAPWAGLK